MDNYNIKELVNDSIRVYSGMVTVFPQFGQEEVLDVDWAPKFEHCFAVNNSTVAFVLESKLFVTPYTSLVVDVLRSEAFHQENFHVPFSNWDYPKEEQQKWNELREKAMESCK